MIEQLSLKKNVGKIKDLAELHKQGKLVINKVYQRSAVWKRSKQQKQDCSCF